jgi:hypothetical protein
MLATKLRIGNDSKQLNTGGKALHQKHFVALWKLSALHILNKDNLITGSTKNKSFHIN